MAIIHIKNQQQLAAMTSGNTYVLDNDITVSNWASLPPLSGVILNGDGHRVNGLTEPLFTSLSDSEVNCLKIHANIVGTTESVGAVANEVTGAFSADGVTVDGVVQNASTDNPFAAGGIIGRVDDGATSVVIKNSTNNARVFGARINGGLIGYSGDLETEKLTLTCNTNTGDIGDMNSSASGGIIGWAGGNKLIANNVNRGTIQSQSWAGGIVAYPNPGVVRNNTNYGNVMGDFTAGGIVGEGNEASVNGNTNHGAITFANYFDHKRYLGGIIGWFSGKSNSLNDNVNDGIIGGNSDWNANDNYVGGIAGNVTQFAEVINNKNSGDVTGGTYVGGITGAFTLTYPTSRYEDNISYCGAITAIHEYAGGVSGYYFNSIGSTATFAGNEAYQSSITAPIGAQRILGGVSNNGALVIGSNYASPTTILTGDNTLQNGLVYTGQVVQPNDPNLGATLPQGESVSTVCPNGETFSNCLAGCNRAKDYTVTFCTNGGCSIDSQTVPWRSLVTKPADPVRGCDKFEGWYTDKALTEPYDFGTPVDGDITLYAKWTRRCCKTVTYLSGNIRYAVQNVADGEPAAQIADPKACGFTFVGWYTDRCLTKEYDFSQPVTCNLTLYAKWERLVTD
jgi:uncharacterized repeat protein (TIGR02543 family)